MPVTFFALRTSSLRPSAFYIALGIIETTKFCTLFIDTFPNYLAKPIEKRWTFIPHFLAAQSDRIRERILIPQ